jgi:hypothetical protein
MERRPSKGRASTEPIQLKVPAPGTPWKFGDGKEELKRDKHWE